MSNDPKSRGDPVLIGDAVDEVLRQAEERRRQREIEDQKRADAVKFNATQTGVDSAPA